MKRFIPFVWNVKSKLNGVVCGGLFAILLIYSSLNSYASELSLAYGVNPPWQTVHVKSAQVDLRFPISGSLWHKIGANAWFESGEGESGALAAWSIGARVESEPLYADLFWGAGYCYRCDQVWLSGHFQFANDVSVGVQGDGVGVGLAYRHISNAGIRSPNRGRDFILFQLKFPI